MPGWRFNNVWSPSRTTLWSSTISKRIGLGSGGFIQPASGNLDNNVRAFAGRGREFAARANLLRASGDVPQSMPEWRGAILLKSNSIVLDFQPHATVSFFQRDDRGLRLGMAQTVAHGFAGDLEQMHGLARIQGFSGFRVDVERELRTARP